MVDEGKAGEAKARPLFNYWTKSAEGLLRWAASKTPYTSLVTALRSENVPEKYVNGLAAKYFKAVYGIYPGQRKDD